MRAGLMNGVARGAAAMSGQYDAASARSKPGETASQGLKQSRGSQLDYGVGTTAWAWFE